MVQGEPNAVCVKSIGGQWVVRVIENGNVSQNLFGENLAAERYAEHERDRLKLPGRPPV
jgi:hypothetical protein